LHADRRGAVLVEFMVALLPLLTTFFVSLQVMQLATARLMVKHANILGARAAAVFANTAGVTPDQPVGVNQDKIEMAVMGSLGPYANAITVKVTVDDKATCSDPYGPVTVKVEGTVRCFVPLGQIICKSRAPFGGAQRAAVVFKDSVTMPHQGARYKGEQSGGGCGD
jgi:Flp pilus assembly protein TadG